MDKRLTSIESFSSWLAAAWSIVLMHPSSYYGKYPFLFSGISSLVSENTLVFLAASYFIFTVVLFESQYWRLTSLLHFTVYAGACYLFLIADSNGQVGYAYAILAIFNLIRWISYIHDRQTQKKCISKNY
jgi:hypothetical protein